MTTHVAPLLIDPQFVVNGVIVGSTIALAAIGLSMIFGILNFINFAHGEYLTVGAYAALVLNTVVGLHIVLALVGAMAFTGAFAAVLDRGLYHPLREKDVGGVGMLITSIGLSMVLRNVIEAVWGSKIRHYAVPSTQAMEFLGLKMTTVQVVIVVVAVLLMVLVHLLLTRTVMGIAMRATSTNQSLALSSGINTDRVVVWTWGIGVGLTTVAGVLIGLNTHLVPTMGFELLLVMFAAVILGGIGDPYGAMVGGLVIGVTQEMSVAVLSPSYKPAVAFTIMVLMLLWRPQGLLGDTA